MRKPVDRIVAGPILRSALPAVFCCLSLAAILRGDEWKLPPTAEVRLASGRAVDYAIHFDRNSLDDSVRVGGGLIALTSSGALLRFTLPAIRLARERNDDEVSCIGRGDGQAVLAGLADGRICRVDPATLDIEYRSQAAGRSKMVRLVCRPRESTRGYVRRDAPEEVRGPRR
jgi:hypothetical protein